ncbi:F-box/LRR-repeat protein 25-like [Bidens hawaiensis]|uniref:F-box/LRR-repeat protein 25-like n=1 Tax=Bidens hawaiensis TaxID=980011 RepID=UPI00404A3227
MDRISQLPGNTVDHILSFLSTPGELVRMSVLSKTWSNLTASFRILEFHINEFRSRKSFFKYVEYTTSRFCRHNFTGSSLYLDTTIKEHAELDIVNSCIELLLKNGVEKLLVDITYMTNLPKYRLPNTLLSVSMLKSLSLTRCELPSHIMLEALEFKSLIFLELWYVHIDDEVIKYFTTSCPFLRTFFIIKCNGFNNFHVYGHQHLEYVRIDYDTPVERIDIEMSNLSRLVIVDCDEIGEPRMNVASCKKLRTVTYYGHLLPNTNGFTNFLPNFPFVEDFSLFPSCESNNMKLSSHSLRRLIVQSECDLEDIELNTPNLDLFVYTCSLYYLFMERHLTHLKTSMECDLDDYVSALWFHKLRRFLGKKNGFKAMNLYINTTEVEVRFLDQIVHV